MHTKVSREVWMRSIDSLVFYARNLQKNDAAVDRMCASIREFRFKIPCLIRSDGEVIDGHLRYGKAGLNATIWGAASPKFMMGGSDETKFDHPTQKPVELMRKPILNHTRTGEFVYDPFLGSGTTLAAAELTGRVCYGLEIDPKYADVTVGRWQQLTGRAATLDGDGRTFEAMGQDRLRMAA